MARIFTKENALESYQKLIQSITEFQIKQPQDNNGYKTATNYNKWLSDKCKMILSENNFEFPKAAIPGVVSKFIYDYLYPDKKAIIDTYYRFDDEHNQYVLNARKSNIPNDAVNIIINSVLLRRGNVVWVEFGYNVGAEFGGKHPAIVIKNCGKTLIVIPLSSQNPTQALENVNVNVPQVYNFPIRERWTNVTRITPISIIRIDFSSKIGSVRNSILREISSKLQENGIK